MDNIVREQLFKQGEKFEFQLQVAVDSYAKFQRGIVQNDWKPLDEDKKQWLLTCRKLRAEVSKCLKDLDDHTTMIKNIIKCPDIKKK